MALFGSFHSGLIFLILVFFLEPFFAENNCIVLLRYDRILKSCKNGQIAKAIVRESGLFWGYF